MYRQEKHSFYSNGLSKLQQSARFISMRLPRNTIGSSHVKSSVFYLCVFVIIIIIIINLVSSLQVLKSERADYAAVRA